MVDRQTSLFSPVGDFLITEAAEERAEERFSEKSQRSQRQDRGRRAPVTTDYSKWESDTDHWDFPGVDTPTESPSVLPKDLQTASKPRTVDADSPDGRSVIDPLSSEERAQEEFLAGVSERDVSLSPDEGLRGVGASGVAEWTDPNIPVQDRWARYDLDPQEEQEDIDALLGSGGRGDAKRHQQATEQTVDQFNRGDIGLGELGDRLSRL